MNWEKDAYKQLFRGLCNQGNTFIHKFVHRGEDIYLIHRLQKDPYTPENLVRGYIYLVYKGPSDMNENVMEYKAVRNRDGLSFIELESIRLPVTYRRMGLGSIILHYLELKVAKEFYPDIKYIKGITIVGDFDLKKFYQKNGYIFDNFAIRKEINI